MTKRGELLEDFCPKILQQGCTLQHAVARGLELEFQLEPGEMLTEPTPSRENRRAILGFEAAEGGVGVLDRLANEPDAYRG